MSGVACACPFAQLGTIHVWEIRFILFVCASACFGGRARRHAYISWTLCCVHVSQSGLQHVHDTALWTQRLCVRQIYILSLHRAILGAPNGAADALPIFGFSRRSLADHKARLHTDAQLSFSLSRVHVCLQALLVLMLDFELLGDWTVHASSFHLS